MACSFNRYGKLLILCFAFFMLSSCMNQSTQDIDLTTEQLINDFGQDVDFISSSNLGTHCKEINQDIIWESGNTVRELQDKIIDSLQLTIDDDIVYTSYQAVKGISLAGIHLFDDNHNIIGSTGGVITVCSNLDDLSSGQHLAKIQFTSLSNELYEYIWLFEVE